MTNVSYSKCQKQ